MSQFGTNELSNLKIQAILQALERNGWNRQRAARDLGCTDRCIRYNIQRLKESGMNIPDSPKGGRRASR